MKDTDKTKDELIQELNDLRERVALMEAATSFVWPENRTRLEDLPPDTRLEMYVFEQLQKRLPICIIRFDRTGVVTLSLGVGLERWGYDRNQLVGINILDTYPPFRDPFMRCLKGETVVYHTDGELEGRIWAFQNYMYQDTSNPEGGCINISLDITEHFLAQQKQRELESQMQHTQKLESLGVMAGGIAHDFNNLLTGILGNAELALLDLPPKAPQEEFLHGICDAAIKAADLCKQMLAYAGKGRYLVEPVDLNNLIEGISNLLYVSISKKVQLSRELSEDLCIVEADPAQLQQVIVNLVTNAAEAIGEEAGAITLSTRRQTLSEDDLSQMAMDHPITPGEYVVLEVKDSGGGIDEETRERIFDPFFTTKFTGRGLGLAAVQGIVRGHHGAVAIDSTLGEGTSFMLCLPAVTHQQHEEELESHTPAAPKSNLALLIDDEDYVLQVAQVMLEREGFKVLTARNGFSGLDLARKHLEDISLVILDLTMPDMSGEETYLKLRELRADLPVLLCSGYHESELSQRFADMGFAGFLQKPFRQKTLRGRIEAALAS